MRIFGIFNRKKRISRSSAGSNLRNSVHPANVNGGGVYTVKRAKVKELLGVETPQESQEVDELLDRAGLRCSLSDQDVESVESCSTEGIEYELERFCDDGTKLEVRCRNITIAPPSCDHMERAAFGLALQSHLRACKSYTQCHEQDTQKLSSDKPIRADSASGSLKTFRQVRPAKLACVSRDKGASPNKGLPPERFTGSHSIGIGNEKTATFIGSFPLPHPSERHYLPSPQIHASEDASSVAHPLPQPPLTAIKSFEDKDYTSLVRGVSCEPPVKPHLTAKEEETIDIAASCDSHRQTMQRLKGGSCQVLQEVPQTAGPMAVQLRGYYTPPSTPPTTPKQQASKTSFIIPPPASPSHAHGVPLNIPPRTPCSQCSHGPQESPPVRLPTQGFWASQNTPPSAPCPQAHSHLLTDKTEKVQLPCSPNRQSPSLNLKVQNKLPALFPYEQSRSAYSPCSSPISGSLCPRKWVKGNLIGSGSFGHVYEGLNEEDGSFFAVKMSSKEAVSPEIQQEVDVLSKLNHPNIVRYLGSSIVEKQLCIFLELMTMGSLSFILRKYKRFDEHTIRNYTKQILLGLEYLHRKRTIHRDIKCSNILVDVNGQVKLSDFGIAKQLGESLASSVKGTPLYMAPEVLVSIKDCYTFSADIWSLGCTVLEMADGKPPWSNLQGFAFMFKVKNGELPPMPDHLSFEGKNFIQQCLKLLPKDRPTASDLLQHPFVLNAVTPEPLLIQSPPPSPLAPLMWLPSSQRKTATGTNEEVFPTSPNPVVSDNRRAQTVFHGR